VYEAFLQRKKDLEEEELRLTSTLAEHEDTLSQIRQRLANPPASVLPTDQAKQALYLAWKRALAEREEYLRQARRRKHDLLKDLKKIKEAAKKLREQADRMAILERNVQDEDPPEGDPPGKAAGDIEMGAGGGEGEDASNDTRQIKVSPEAIFRAMKANWGLCTVIGAPQSRSLRRLAIRRRSWPAPRLLAMGFSLHTCLPA
jgi:hypothetical protein